MRYIVKVVHIADKFGVRGSSVHGVSRLFSWWLPRFDRSRFDVRLIGLRKADQATENLGKQGIDVISLNKKKFDPTTAKAIIDYIRREKPHIIHLHGYGSTNFGRIAARVTGVKVVIHEHFVDPDMPAYQIPFDYLLAKYTDYGIAVSNSVKEFMVKKRFIPEKKVEVVFNGAPLHRFRPVSDEEVGIEKKRWQIPNNTKVIATIGRLDKQKGLNYFIDAAAQILQKRRDVIFLVVGDGPLMDDLKTQAESNGAIDQMIFSGYISNIPLIQSMVDIQVFPSLWEGTPLTLFEAMSMQRPIVSTNVDGLGEVLIHEKNALVVPPLDSSKLAAAIETLLDDPVKAKKLAEKAQIDSRRYDIQYTVETMQGIYDQLVDGIPAGEVHLTRGDVNGSSSRGTILK